MKESIENKTSIKYSFTGCLSQRYCFHLSLSLPVLFNLSSGLDWLHVPSLKLFLNFFVGGGVRRGGGVIDKKMVFDTLPMFILLS